MRSVSHVLSIRCFGALELRRGVHVLRAFPTRRSKLLFAYLVLNRGRAQSREALVGSLWGDETEALARRHLRMELWRLRAFLEPRGIARGSFLRSGDHEVAFGPTRRYWLDIEEFESRVRESVVPGDSLSPQKVTMLREAVDLYRGDLLEGVYENWALDQRARLRSLFREALERLMRHHAAARDWSGAISYAERLLSADPFLERVHRALMWFHYAQGDRPAALRQYQLCTEFLRRELSVEPMGETRRLFEEIRSERQRTVHPPLPGFTIPGVPASAT